MFRLAGPNYLFFAAFFADFFLPPPPFFAAFFFPPFLVAISSMCSFFSSFFSLGPQPQDTVLTSVLWARVNGAQHLAI